MELFSTLHIAGGLRTNKRFDSIGISYFLDDRIGIGLFLICTIQRDDSKRRYKERLSLKTIVASIVKSFIIKTRMTLK